MVAMVNARGTETGYEYDALGRRVRRWNPDTDDRWSYDEAGNVVRAANQNEEAVFAYDSRNRMTEERYPLVNMRVGYGYDLAGRLSSLTYPGGEVVSYGWDAAGQVTGVTDSEGGRIGLAGRGGRGRA
jgi:YD repeat-containing protein